MAYTLDSSRTIAWSAGSDQWNSGSLPTYTGVAATGLTEGDGTTNNASAIQTQLNALSSGQALEIPAGIYYVNSNITIPSNKALRGAKRPVGTWLPSADATATTLKFGASGKITFGSGGSRGTERVIADGFTKGSQSLTMAAGHGFSTGNWISLFEDGDSTIPTDNGGADWLGENNGSNLIQQFARVESVNVNAITISRPLYWGYASGNNPGAKVMTWRCQYGGLENIRLNGFADHTVFLEMFYCLFCWVKGVETYNAGADDKEWHVHLQWSHGCEIRDSYMHYGRASASDQNYGIGIFNWNSDHKIENNILRHHRHSIAFEGGGSGCAVLYNYIDDNYTDDLTYLGSARFNHGSHPMMNLVEGNIVSSMIADDVWGSSSHFTVFRNHLWGDETGTGVPSFPPDYGHVCICCLSPNRSYNFLGNVLGASGAGYPSHANWNAATVLNTAFNDGNPDDSPPDAPCVYGFGSAATRTATILHGNYDYRTDGVAYWDGGADHALVNSLYYGSQPAFLGTLPWPTIDGTTGAVANNAARYVFLNGAEPPSGSPPTGTPVLSVR